MYHNDGPGEGSGNPFQRLLEAVQSGRAPLPLIGGIAAVAVVGIILVALVVSGGSSSGDDTTVVATSTPRPTAISGGLRTEVPEPEATIDLNRPIGQGGHLTSVGPDDRMVIPSIGVDAPLTYRKVGPDGVMPDPEGPDDIAYYDFSEWEGMGGGPGLGGNTVLAGHVDSGRVACNNGTVPPPCEAVLWDLVTLRLGDVIEVHVQGQVYRYEVTSNQPVPAVGGPWDQIVSSTEQESLTIITCGGDFNRATGEYTNRQVVTATLVQDA